MARTLVVDGDHLTRLIKMCREMGRGRGLSLVQMQKKFKTSRRTVFRELSALHELGIEVTLTDGRYQVKQSSTACKKLIADHHTDALAKLLKSSLR